MNTSEMLNDLRAQRNRIDEAITALECLENGGRSRRGRPAGAANAGRNGRKNRHMSAAARRRISQAMKARWAERKKSAKAKAA